LVGALPSPPPPLHWARYHLRHLLLPDLLRYQLKDAVEAAEDFSALERAVRLAAARRDAGPGGFTFDRREHARFLANKAQVTAERFRAERRAVAAEGRQLQRMRGAIATADAATDAAASTATSAAAVVGDEDTR
jgi:hypothetical protein